MKKIFGILCLATLFTSRPSGLFAQVVDKGDSMALVDLYNSTDGPHWTGHQGWLEGPISKWQYITLTQNGTRVRIVYLYLNNLKGEMPASLGNLTACEQLDLEYNKIKGSIPVSLGGLTTVKNLWLGHNNLSGKIPASLGNLPNLTWLDLDNNQLSGPVPETLGSMPNLKTLHLNYNKFTFDGLETVVRRNIQNLSYEPQDTMLEVKNRNDTLYVSAGGNFRNNTYKWYAYATSDTIIVGDSVFVPKKADTYYVWVTNSIATSLTLKSNPAFASPIAVIDPNPAMITANGLISTNLSTIDYSNTVTKAATDGVTKLLLVTKSSYPVTFSTDGNISGTLSSINNQLAKATQITVTPDASGRVACIYTVPDGYGTASPQGERTCTIRATGVNNYNSTVSIKLVTPPVILVHGLWSNPAIWDKGGFTSYLSSVGIGKVYLADYSYSSSLTFDPNSHESYGSRVALLVKIILALKEYHDLKIAVTQVDVVGHSLGGLMTRSLSQQSDFLNRNNYYKGFVHKLITLGTPHRGSPLGPELYNKKDSWSYHHIPGTNVRVPIRLSDLLELLGMPIGSALKDFGVTSQGVNDLKKIPLLKTFSITATHGQEDNIVGGITSYLVMDKLIRFASGRSLDEVMKSRCDSTVLPNDLIVPYRSQTGYISSTQLFRGTSHSIPGFVTETNNPLIQRRVAELLLSSDTTEFSTGFPAPSDFPLDCDNATQLIGTTQPLSMQQSVNNGVNSANATGTEYVQISSPLRGKTYRQNIDTTITIGYETFGGAIPTNALLMIQDAGWYQLPTVAPYTVTVSLPKNIQTGRLRAVLLVNDTTGIRLCDTSYITVLPEGTLNRVTIQPSSLNFDSLNRQAKLLIRQEYTGVYGTYANNVSSTSEGVTYTTQNNQSVIRVAADGTITAVSVGKDTLAVSVHDSTFIIPVVVNTNFSARTLYPNIIDFTAVSDKVISDIPFALTATAASGENVHFTLVSGPVEIVNGVVMIKGSGLVIIQATSEGSAYFNSAEPVTKTFYIGSVLPLQLLTFTGSMVNGDVLLNWSTANEKNTSHFVVERSTDGVHFSAVGIINAANSSSGIGSYTFNDKSITMLNFSRIYYRLQEVDKDSKQTFSIVVLITTNHVKDFIVHPNPAKRVITLLLNKLPENDGYIRLYNMTGSIIMSQKLTNQLSQKIYLPVVSNGNYKLVIWSNGKIVHQQSVMIIK